jgi:poly(A) polymerase
MTERQYAIDVVRRLHEAGYTAYWAGGCVRDELLGIPPDDYDIACDAAPVEVQKLFPRTVAVGASFGVVEVLGPRHDDGHWIKVQVATFRSDGAYTDGRHPDGVVFSTPEDDAHRRDFTINGLFYDPLREEIHDYVGGREDLKRKLLRAIGDPFARFAEDKLRILRAVRMATRFDLRIDEATFEAANCLAPEITVVSPERIADELRKLLVHPNRGRGVTTLSSLSLAGPVLPEIASTIDGAARLAAALPAHASFELSFAAIHAVLTPLQVRTAARRLRLSNDEVHRIEWLVAMQSALLNAWALPKSVLYPILTHPGIDDLLALHEAKGAVEGITLTALEHVRTILAGTPREVLDPPPLITGDDLTRRGWLPGPMYKQVLKTVRDRQLDGRVSTAKDALDLALRLFESPSL